VGKDFVRVISPIGADGSYQFWTPCRTGKMPLTGECKGPEYDLSFTFNLGYAWEFKRRVEKYLGTCPAQRGMQRGQWVQFQEAIISVIPDIFGKHGFSVGQLTAIGYARRPNKGKWDFSFTGINVKIPSNFILAKLMGHELFEDEVWLAALKQMFAEEQIA
jgi:hypothetical protein